MSLINKDILSLEPYVPGEQPKDGRYIKLNTNESPYPPCPGVRAALESVNYEELRLYSDPTGSELNSVIAETLGVSPDMVLAGGGSDELLGYAFLAFFGRGDEVYYPDVTYGFYGVLANLFGLKPCMLPLREDFTVNADDYINVDGHIVIANPNAPTGIALVPDEIDRILAAKPDRLFIADEAYVYFSNGKSCEPLLKKHKNLLIIRTYSKSYAMAGMRLGYALGAPELIDALRRVKDSFNPYNLDRISIKTGIAAVRGVDYLREITSETIKTREYTKAALEKRGFHVLPSETNFLFVRRRGVEGARLYNGLKSAGILVRHFSKPRIHEFIRVTIGTREDMDSFLNALEAMAL